MSPVEGHERIGLIKISNVEQLDKPMDFTVNHLLSTVTGTPGP